MTKTDTQTVTHTSQPPQPAKTSWWKAYRFHLILPIVTLFVGVAIGQHIAVPNSNPNPDSARFVEPNPNPDSGPPVRRAHPAHPHGDGARPHPRTRAHADTMTGTWGIAEVGPGSRQ